jgi:hypothetical protein
VKENESMGRTVIADNWSSYDLTKIIDNKMYITQDTMTSYGENFSIFCYDLKGYAQTVVAQETEIGFDVADGYVYYTDRERTGIFKQSVGSTRSEQIYTGSLSSIVDMHVIDNVIWMLDEYDVWYKYDISSGTLTKAIEIWSMLGPQNITYIGDIVYYSNDLVAGGDYIGALSLSTLKEATLVTGLDDGSFAIYNDAIYYNRDGNLCKSDMEGMNETVIGQIDNFICFDQGWVYYGFDEPYSRINVETGQVEALLDTGLKLNLDFVHNGIMYSIISGPVSTGIAVPAGTVSYNVM